MAAPRRTSSRTAFTALALTVLAGTVFFAGSGRAIAPEQACVPEPEAAAAGQQAQVDPLDPGQRALAEHLARRYYIATEVTRRWVGVAYSAAREVGLDPILVLAVISIESRFNPVAESVMGAKGLMQIIPRFHRDKLDPHGGDDAVLDPEINIAVGARILQEYVYRTGTLEAGLQFYNGAMSDPTAQYAQKVLAERGRLQELVRAAARVHRVANPSSATGS